MNVACNMVAFFISQVTFHPARHQWVPHACRMQFDAVSVDLEHKKTGQELTNISALTPCHSGAPHQALSGGIAARSLQRNRFHRNLSAWRPSRAKRCKKHNCISSYFLYPDSSWFDTCQGFLLYPTRVMMWSLIVESGKIGNKTARLLDSQGSICLPHMRLSHSWNAFESTSDEWSASSECGTHQ